MGTTKRYIFGEWTLGSELLTVAEARTICEKSRAHATAFSQVPIDEIYSLLERLRDIWSNPENAYRREAQERLPALTGFSAEMVRLGLEELGAMLDPAPLRKKMETELRGIPVGFGYREDPKSSTFLQYQPLGSVFHVLSGNVFLVGPGSLLQGLLTRNVTLLKMSSAETTFMPRFLETLVACDPDGVISRSIACFSFSSSQKDVIEVFKTSVDALVLWGGEDAVRAYRNDLPARTRIVLFGPKLSFAITTKAGVDLLGVETIASKLAFEIAIWDQGACTAPQTCFVEGEANATLLAKRLGLELAALDRKLPAGLCERDRAVEIRKLRAIAEIAEGRGDGLLVAPSTADIRWTVTLDRELSLDPSPLHRTLKIIPYRDVAELETLLEPMRGYLQTVGVAGSPTEQFEFGAKFARYGAQRVFALGSMSGGDIDDPHDGQYDLPLLLNLTVTRPDPKHVGRRSALDLMSAIDRERWISARLRETLSYAKRSKFYAERLAGVEVKSLADLPKLPILERTEFEANMPPRSDALLTRPVAGGFVTRSGGSSGEPKFSTFDRLDWDAMLTSAVGMMRASGLAAEDRIMNFMAAGNLYGGFISFNHVFYTLGLQSFCFGSSYDVETLLRVRKEFGVNVLAGMSPVAIEVMRKCKAADPSFTLEKVIYAGQPMSTPDRQWLTEACGVKRVISVIGATEANQIGYQCEYLAGSYHHLIDDYNWIELVDDSGAAVAPGEIGRILVTSLQKKNLPVIRYSIGDAGRIDPKPCACGRRDRVIEYRGRWDDIVSIGSMNIKFHDVREALADLPISQLQLVAGYQESRDLIRFLVETTGELGVLGREKLVREIECCLNERVSEFREIFASGGFVLEIKVLGAGEIPRNPRTGKVKAIRDERQP